MTSTEVPLCICHHFNDQHPEEKRGALQVVNPPCGVEGCKCQGFQPVSHKSSHVYQRNMAPRVVRKRFDQLHAGDRVVVQPGFSGGLRIAVDRADALVAQVLTGAEREEPGENDRFRPAKWIWNVATDLGELGPYSGTAMTMIVKGANR